MEKNYEIVENGKYIKFRLPVRPGDVVYYDHQVGIKRYFECLVLKIEITFDNVYYMLSNGQNYFRTTTDEFNKSWFLSLEMFKAKYLNSGRFFFVTYLKTVDKLAVSDKYWIRPDGLYFPFFGQESRKLQLGEKWMLSEEDTGLYLGNYFILRMFFTAIGCNFIFRSCELSGDVRTIFNIAMGAAFKRVVYCGGNVQQDPGYRKELYFY